MDSTNHSEAWNNIYLILAAVKCFLIQTMACSYYCYRRHLERISALLPHIRLISDLTRFDPFMIESEATVMNELETVIQVPRVSEIGAVGYKYSKFFRRLTRGFGGHLLALFYIVNFFTYIKPWNSIYLILAAVKCFLIQTMACSYYCYRRHLERISALLPHIRLISDLTRFDPFMIESEATVMNELETVIQVPRVSEIGAVGYKYSKFFRRLTRGFGGHLLALFYIVNFFTYI
ncbi:uncharacterized protein LOC124369601 [Homalodisca vitripennis]|uniref:uncharacterized protein LOC124369601 n=1 Tax=Homalodisca vitripennis TaxID=197043 RepID=UPI001EEBCDEC|nr:uncharacterized protein LOC124369601 [Homalodisca vitripennis]